MKNYLIQLFCTKVGWLAVCMVLVVVFGALSNFIEWFEYLMFASLAYPVILGIVMMVYAFIINPIRRLKNKDK